MSYQIHVEKLNPQTGEWEDMLGKDSPFRLMGFHSYGKELWGADVMKALGEYSPVSVAGQDGVTQLEHDVELIQNNLEIISAALPPQSVSDLKSRYLRNLRNAIRVARTAGDSVEISIL